MKPRILVTGASGFVGRHVLPLLCERNFEIFALARSPVPEITDVNWIQLDLMQQDEIPKLPFVHHILQKQEVRQILDVISNYRNADYKNYKTLEKELNTIFMSLSPRG